MAEPAKATKADKDSSTPWAYKRTIERLMERVGHKEERLDETLSKKHEYISTNYEMVRLLDAKLDLILRQQKETDDKVDKLISFLQPTVASVVTTVIATTAKQSPSAE
jgi:hypothetical protein